jgi:hypothetical protein
MRQCGRRPTCLDDFLNRFRDMAHTSRALAVVYLISFIDSFAYYAFSYALIIHLGSEVGLSDSTAGLFYGIFGMCISIAGVPLGFAVDWLGVRNSICGASALGFIARLAMAYAVLLRTGWVSTLTLCVGVAPCIAWMYPTIPIAIKNYTTKDTLNMGLTINYGIMNLAGVLSTGLVELMRLYWGNNILLMLPPYAMLIAFSALLQLPMFFAALFGLKDGVLNEETGETEVDVTDNAGRTMRQRARDVLGQANFWRAVIMVMCLTGAKSSFRYFDALYLPYVTRAYADAATFPYLILLGMNPAICIATTMSGAITIVTDRLDPLNAMIIGTFVGGIAPFWMALGPFVPPIMLYVLFTTLGEIIWATVAYTFFMRLTKKGDEGAYSALAGLPTFMAKMMTGSLTGEYISQILFVAKTMTGSLTGGLMSRFCPERKDPEGHVIPPPPPQLWGSPEHCNGLIIWSVIGVTTVSSSVLLWLFRRKLRYDPADGALLALGDGVSAEDDSDLSDVELIATTVVPLTKVDGEDGHDAQPRTKVVHASAGDENRFPDMDPIPLDAQSANW